MAHGDQPIANLGNRLDGEGAAANVASEMTNARNDPVQGVVADDPTVPAQIDQFVPSDDATFGPGKRHQHLHNPRLDRLASVTALDLPGRGIDGDVANSKTLLVRQDDLSRDSQTVMFIRPHVHNITRRSETA